LRDLGFKKDWQYYRFCLYGFLKNMRFFEPFLMLFLLEKLPGNYFQVMTLYSIRLIFRAILEIPSGVIADGLGRKGSLLFSYSLYIVSFIAYFFADTFQWLIIPSVLYGIADAFRTGTHKAMIVEYLKINNWQQSKTAYYGHTRSWSQVGSALSAILAVLIKIFTNNFDLIFLYTTIPYIIGMALLFSYPDELNGTDINLTIKSNLKKAFSLSWNEIFNVKNIKKLTGISYFEGYHSAVKDFVQPIIESAALFIPIGLALNHEYQVAATLGLIYFVLHLFSAFGSRTASSFTKALKSPESAINRLSIIGAITGLAITLFIYFKMPLLAGIMFIPLYVLLNIQRPFVMTFASEQYNSKIMSTVLSVESQLGSIIGALIALLLGALAQRYNLTIALGTVSIISLIIALINRVNPEKQNENN
jgi:MFS family permease